MAALPLTGEWPTPKDLSLELIRKAGQVAVGIDPSYQPFAAYNGKGQIGGFDVDFARGLARRLAVGIHFVTVDFGAIFDGLRARKYDLIVSAVEPWPDYGPHFIFSNPYFDNGLVLAARRGGTGKRLGIEAGSEADIRSKALRSELPGATFVLSDYQDQIEASVIDGRLDGAIVDVVTAYRWARDHEQIVIDPKRLTADPYVVALRADEPSVLNAVNLAIAAFAKDGFLDHLDRVWLKE